MSAPRVWNKRTDLVPGDAVYVGRPTCWGNPFRTKDGYTRENAVAKFRDWVWRPEQKPLRNRARRLLKGRDLICWCSPLLCHASIWLEIANHTEEETA